VTAQKKTAEMTAQKKNVELYAQKYVLVNAQKKPLR
jgi:hypothetical protein